MPLTKDQLLGPVRPRTKKVEIDGLGEVRIREFSAAEWEPIEREVWKLSPGDELKITLLPRWRERFIAIGVANDDGGRMFTDEEARKFVELRGAMASSDLAGKIMEFSRIADGDDIEDIEGN